jgi:phospholipase C
LRALGRPLASLLAVCALAGGSAAAASASTAPSAGAAAAHATTAVLVSGQNTSPIKHVVEIMQENHTFDNFFGQFPGADGIPPGTTLPNPVASESAEPRVSPIFAGPNEGNIVAGISNIVSYEQMAMDYEPAGELGGQPRAGYLMDHYTTTTDGLQAITEWGPSFDPNLQYLAKNYELGDQNFQAAIGPTQPNVHYALTGTDDHWPYNSPLPPGTTNQNDYSIFKELDAAGLTSKAYWGLPSGTLGDFWYDMFPPSRMSDATTTDQFSTDLANNNLPSFSLLRAAGNYQEGEPSDIEEGDAWVGEIVDAIAKSPEWKSTAIFVTYDEGGGFWDHVPPPIKTADGYGTRTPMVIASPYARPGVYHGQTTNTSILSFIQALWHLKPLNNFNAQQNNLLAAFNFQQAPLPAPQMPQAPASTLAISTSAGTKPAPGSTFTVTLQATSPGFDPETTAAGPVSLKLIPPQGVPVPADFPSTITMNGGTASFTLSLPAVGYYRIEATGPGSSMGWETVGVGVGPNTVSP